LTEQNGKGAVPARNGAGQELQSQTVLLLSKDPDERGVFETAIGPDQRLIVTSGIDELRTALDCPADTVIIDLPASERVAAWERVRARHAGMVLIAVDNQTETEDWPPDLARRFLVRPLHTEEVAAALAVRPRILREPPAARRRRLAQARRPPVVPPPAPAGELPPPPEKIEPVRRLSTDESLWEETGEREPTAASGTTAAADATSSPPRGEPAGGELVRTGAAGTPPAVGELEPPAGPAGGRSRGRSRLTAVAMLLLLVVATAVGGIAIGRATASPEPKNPRVATPSSAPGSTAAPGAVVREKTPAACDAALDDADAALSYLVGNVRDQRLTQAMQNYQRDRSACRAASR
jgi:hypothetical protein